MTAGSADADLVIRMILESEAFRRSLLQAGVTLEGFTKKTQSAADKIRAFAGKVAVVGQAALKVTKYLVGVALVIAAIASVISVRALKAFAEFQQSIAEIASLAPKVAGEIRTLGESLKSVSIAFGQGLKEITRAAYDLISAGMTIAGTAVIIKSAAMAAVAGLTDIKTSSSAATSVITAFGMGASQVNEVFDSIFMTVRKGRLVFSEYAQNIGVVLPTAKAAGVSLNELNAALTVVTLAGIPFQEATTAVNRMLTQLAAPTDKLKKNLDSLGITTVDVHGKMLPLIDVMEQFRGLTLEEVRSVTGEMRAARAVLAIANNIEKFRETLLDFSAAYGATFDAWLEQVNTLMAGWNRFRAALAATWVEIGEILEPIGRTILVAFGDAFMELFDYLNAAKGEFKSFITEIVPAIDNGVRNILGSIRTMFEVLMRADMRTLLGHVVNNLKIVLAVCGNIVTVLLLILDIATQISYQFGSMWVRALSKLIPGMDIAFNAMLQAGKSSAEVVHALNVAWKEFMISVQNDRGIIERHTEAMIRVRKDLAKAMKGQGPKEPEHGPSDVKPFELPFSEDSYAKFASKERAVLEAAGATQDEITDILAKALEDRKQLEDAYWKEFPKQLKLAEEAQKDRYETGLRDEEAKLEALKESNFVTFKAIGKQKKLIDQYANEGNVDLVDQAKANLKSLREQFALGEEEIDKQRDAIKKFTEEREKAADRLAESARRTASAAALDAVKNTNKNIAEAERAIKKIRDAEQKEAERVFKNAQESQKKVLNESFDHFKASIDRRQSYYADAITEQKRLLEDLQQSEEQVNKARWDNELDYQKKVREAIIDNTKENERAAVRYVQARKLALRASNTRDMETRRRMLTESQDILFDTLSDKKASKKEKQAAATAIQRLQKRQRASFNDELEQVRKQKNAVLKAIHDMRSKLAQMYKDAANKTLYIKNNFGEMEEKARKLLHHISELKANAQGVLGARGSVGKDFAQFHEGGWVTPTDTLARLLPGEFVVRKDVAQQNSALLAALNRGSRPNVSQANSNTFNLNMGNRGIRDLVLNHIVPELNRQQHRGLKLGR